MYEYKRVCVCVCVSSASSPPPGVLDKERSVVREHRIASRQQIRV